MYDEQPVDQLNVLVIDDDPDVRALLVDVLNHREHQAIAVGSAEEGLEMLPTWTFQVAFIDQNLPGMEGMLLGEYLRRNNPDMLIALVTGAADRKLERRSRALSIRVVPKPFDVAQIYELLDDYKAEAEDRRVRRRKREDEDYAPPIARYADELDLCFDIPGVSNRIEGRLVATIKRSLNELRSVNRYTERDRVVALAGLLTAKVLGVDLPRTDEGATLYEEFDELMRTHGRRTEFEEARRTSRPPPPDKW